MSATAICASVDELLAFLEDVPSSIETKPVYRTNTKRAHLYQPNLGDLVPIIERGLQQNFQHVTVKQINCPDLREWGHLSSKGICGHPRLLDVGGVPFMFDPAMQSTVNYDMHELLHACDMKEGLIIGAGAADPKVIGKNGELIPNVKVTSNDTHHCTVNTHYAKMVSQKSMKDGDVKPAAENAGNEVPVCRAYAGQSCGCLSNLFVCDGECGAPVLYIKAKTRTGSLNFTHCIREALQKVRGVGNDKQIGMGGVIKINAGKIKGHVMPDFMTECVNAMDPKQTAVDDWLYFYECGPNLVMMATLITGDPTENDSLHLRVEHTHFYSLLKGKNEGGHYHYDTTPNDIEYEAYFNTAAYVYRIDDAFQYNINKGGETHKFDAKLIK